MGLRAANEGFRRKCGTAPRDVLTTRGRIQQHGDETQSEERCQGDVKVGGHRLQNEHRVAGLKSRLAEQRRRARRDLLKLAERKATSASRRSIDDGRRRGPYPGLRTQNLRDVHGGR